MMMRLDLSLYKNYFLETINDAINYQNKAKDKNEDTIQEEK